MNREEIIYFGKPTTVECDRLCSKAWGSTGRPRNDDDETIPDSELGTAPEDPGTYEGGEGKPLTPDDFPNKWCVRECERSKFID